MKRIAISQRVIFADNAPGGKGANRDALEQDYVEYYEPFGVMLIPIPNFGLDLPGRLTELKIDGIILSGGNDVNPTLYGESPGAGSTHADERDRTDGQLLDFAIEKNMPVFCECRGAQFLNVYCGGQLKKVSGHVVPQHPVQVSEIAGLSPACTLNVNSSHNFGFADAELADELEVFARSADKTIEGVFHKSAPIAGVLWHPERKNPAADFSKKLVQAFLDRQAFWK